MASLYREIDLEAPADQVWDAVRDVGALHTRLVPGFVVDTQMDGEARLVTFANGLVAREAIVSLDDERRRLVAAMQDQALAAMKRALERKS